FRQGLRVRSGELVLGAAQARRGDRHTTDGRLRPALELDRCLLARRQDLARRALARHGEDGHRGRDREGGDEWHERGLHGVCSIRYVESLLARRYSRLSTPSSKFGGLFAGERGEMGWRLAETHRRHGHLPTPVGTEYRRRVTGLRRPRS